MLVKWTGGSDASGTAPAAISIYGPDDTVATEFALDAEVEIDDAFAASVMGRSDFEAVDFALLRLGEDGAVTLAEPEEPVTKIMVQGGPTLSLVSVTAPETPSSYLVVRAPAEFEVSTLSVYELQLEAVSSDVDAPIDFEITTGDLPPGLLMDEAGLIAGTTEAITDTYTFTVTATQGATSATLDMVLNVV